MRLRVFACLLFACAPLVAAGREPCAATEEVRAAIAAIDARTDPDADADTSGRRHIDALHAVLAKHPGDPFVLGELFVVYVRSMDDKAGFATELAAAIKAGLTEPTALYFEALLLSPDKKAKEAKLREALKLDPTHQDANRSIAALFLERKNLASAKSALLTALDACPTNIESYELLPRFKDTRLLGNRVKILRGLLAKETGTSVLAAYEILWDLSFRVTPPAAQKALRAQVAADEKRLRSIYTAKPDPALLRVIATGYKTLGDEESSKWVVSERAQRWPASREAVEDASEALHEAEPKERARTAVDRHARAAKRLETTREWVKRWPQWISPWDAQLSALQEESHASLADVETATAALLKLEAASVLSIASAYDQFGVHTDRIPALAKKSIARAEQELRRAQRDASPDESEVLAFMARQIDGMISSARSLVVRAELKLGHRAEAQAVVLAMAQALTKPLASDADEEAKEERHSFEASLYEAKGHVALANKNNADALANFLHAIAIVEPATEPADPEEHDVRNDAALAWKALGGSAEAFALLQRVDVKKSGGSWKQVDRPMKAFSLQDLNGKTWKLGDLKGKIVFINAWATWCGPCKQEIPEVKKLQALLAARKDVVLLSFNEDDDMGPVAPFVAKNEITYPVLLASQVEDLLPKGGIPVSLVVDKKGHVRAEVVGFTDEPGKWLADALASIEKAR